MSWKYKLKDLAKSINGKLIGDESAEFTGVSIDTRTLQKGDVFFALPGTKVDGHQFVEQALNKGAVAVVVTRGDIVPSIHVNNTLLALQKFARWHRSNVKCQIFAITGSCGKTTTKELISAVLSTKYKVVTSKGNFNNELGCPLSILQIDEDTEWGVIEMGAGKRGDIAELCYIAYPDESVITTIAPAHLEGLGSIEGVAEEKSNIAKCLPPWGYFYVNTDNIYCLDIAKKIIANKIYYGNKGDVRLKSYRKISPVSMEVEIEPVGKLLLPLCSPSILSNFLLAIAVSLKHKIPVDDHVLTEAYYRAGRIKTYSIGQFTIIDDTYNANPVSMKSALEYLELTTPQGYRCAVLGDMLELGDDSDKFHYLLGKQAGECGVDFLFIYGNHSQAIEKGAKEGGVRLINVCDSHEEIAEKIVETIPPQSRILVKGSRGMTMEKVKKIQKKIIKHI